MKTFIKHLGHYLVNISPTVFIVSTLTFIGYFALENFKVGLISNYFDLNKLLLVCLLSGLITIFYSENLANHKLKSVRNNGLTSQYYLFISLFVILLGLFLAKYLSVFGKISPFLAVSGAIAVYIIIYLFHDSRRKN